MSDTWVLCSRCDEEWPSNCYKAAGSASSRASAICDACFLERYPARITDCIGCGKRMKTRGKGRATCRPCRKAKKEQRAIEAATCRTCLKDCRGLVMKAGQCDPCYSRDWRARHGVNGRQTIGAWKQDPSARRAAA